MTMYAKLAMSNVRDPLNGKFTNCKVVRSRAIKGGAVPQVDLVIQRDGGPYIRLRMDTEASEEIAKDMMRATGVAWLSESSSEEKPGHADGVQAKQDAFDEYARSFADINALQWAIERALQYVTGEPKKEREHQENIAEARAALARIIKKQPRL